MPEPGDATLQVTYKGADVSAQLLRNLFAAAVQELEKSQATKAKNPTAKGKANPLGEAFRTPDIDRAAAELKDEGVLFQVLKQPGQEPVYTFVFKGKDLSTIQKALKSLLDDATIEKTLERDEATPQDKGEPGTNKGKPRIFKGKDLQDDIRIAREAVNLRNAQRAKTRPPQVPSKGLDL